MKQVGNIATSERVHIGFYGRCNSGKSSLINAIASQEVSIVSEQAGTTTDSVVKNICAEYPWGIPLIVTLMEAMLSAVKPE